MAATNRATEHVVDPDDGRMSFLGHLDELRTRLIYSCMALACGMAVSFIFVHRIADTVLSSMLASLPPGAALILTRPGEGFSFYLDLALMGGVVVAAPVVTYQAWRFIVPGLYSNEKRLIVPFLVFAVAGAIAGTVFSHRVLFPSMMAFFASFDSPRMRFVPRVEDTFALYKNTLIAMVLVFQIPTLVFVLARIRAVTARWLLRHVNYALLAAVVLGAVLTPSADPWNQLLLSAPMFGMYLVGIAVAWLSYPRSHSRAEDNGGTALRLVFAASVLERAHRTARTGEGLRLIKSRELRARAG